MEPAIHIADAVGRVTLPDFANTSVMVEKVSKDEYRVRKTSVLPPDEMRFPEEDMPIELSERDAVMLLEMIENPPKPIEASRRAAKRFKENYG